MNTANQSAPLKSAIRSVSRALRPPPKLTCSEWADKYRILSSEASAEPGRWRTSRAEYQRGIMDAATSGKYEVVILKTSSQVGKTDLLGNILAWHIDMSPCPALFVMPNLRPMGEAWSKDRLAPMIRDTPRLKAIMGDPSAKKTGQSIIHRGYAGGSISVAGSNSPASLSSRPIQLLLMDEVDRMGDSGSEGDAVGLALARQTTFWNRLAVLTSTPVTEGASRIDAEFRLTDQNYYFVPCPDCNHYQTLRWENVVFDKADPYNTAHYACEECGSALTEAQKNRAVSRGEWRPTAVAKGKRTGFALNSIYSPWMTMGRIAGLFREAYEEKDQSKLQVWTNTILGETWREDGEGVDSGELMERIENYDKDSLPDDILVITAGCDIQADRIEMSVYGWAEHKERWLIEHLVLWGDVEKSDVWEDLDDALKTRYMVAGRGLPIACTLIDSGYLSSVCYAFTKPRQGRRIFSCKGAVSNAAPLVGRGQLAGNVKAKLWMIGTHQAKDSILLHSLKLTEPGPGYIHFPHTVDAEFFAQLTAEQRKTKMVRGRPQAQWVPVRKRNEALDCVIYALSALDILNPRWETIREKRDRPVEKPTAKPAVDRSADSTDGDLVKRLRAARNTGKRGFATDIRND